MRIFRRALAASLSLAMIGLLPGLPAYQAAAQTISVAALRGRVVVGGALGANAVSGVPTAFGAPLEAIPAAFSSLPPISSIPTASELPGAEAPFSAVEALGEAAPLYEAQPAAKSAGSWRPFLTDSRAVAPAAEKISAMSSGEARSVGAVAMDAILGTRSKAAAGEVAVVGASKMDAGAALKPSSKLAISATIRGISNLAAPSKAGAPRKIALYGLAAASVASSLASAGVFGSIAVYLGLIIPSLIVHEFSHAKVADWLGDATPRSQGRLKILPRGLYFNKSGWDKGFLPRFYEPGFLSHIDPIMTLALPVVSLIFQLPLFGAARPVLTSPFNSPRDQMKIGLAGPGSNFALAALGAAAFGGLAAAGIAGIAASILGAFTFYNIFLGILNLIPIAPFDGAHVMRGVLDFVSPRLGDGYATFNETKVARLGFFPVVIIFMFLGPALSALAMGATGWLLGTAAVLGGAQLASAGMPAMAAAAMLLGSLAAVPAPSIDDPAPAAVTAPASPVDLILMFPEGDKKITQDAHISWINVNQPGGVDLHFQMKQSLTEQLLGVGLDQAAIDGFEVTPRAVYRRINAATVRVSAEKSQEFAEFLAAKGVKVFSNGRRKIITPVPIEPESVDPQRRGAATMVDVLKATKADSLIEEARKRWGPPEMSWVGRLALRLAKVVVPQPPIAVIDSGADTSHPQLKRVARVVNATSGPNVDDIGHGSWVTSMVLNFAKWSRNLTHYKTFVEGGANLDDILKALTMAGNDGNLVISNSWGSDDGDPKGPDALLVEKLAQEGHVMVFAAGNAGPGANTVGAPAIVRYKERVLAVAAADKDEKIASFSSRGPASPKTAGTDYPHVPDLTAVGYNVEGAWPTSVGGADRTDGELGPVKAISGTSMSTPDVAGAIALLCMLFGVTKTGERLDQIVHAIMTTLHKTGQSRDAEGEGFMNVNAAYEALNLAMKPVAPGFLARLALRVAGGNKS